MSVTNTILGNTHGNDHNFLGFGYTHTGFSWGPLLSNLQFLRLGAALHPLEDMECFKDMETGINMYWFRKDQRRGGVSDRRRLLDRSDLGHEVDLWMNWRILSDLTATVRYGVFYPGHAFDSRDPEEFLSFDITYSF